MRIRKYQARNWLRKIFCFANVTSEIYWSFRKYFFIVLKQNLVKKYPHENIANIQIKQRHNIKEKSSNKLKKQQDKKEINAHEEKLEEKRQKVEKDERSTSYKQRI